MGGVVPDVPGGRHGAGARRVEDAPRGVGAPFRFTLSVWLAVCVLASASRAQAATDAAPAPARSGLHALDWLVVVLYAAAVLWIGWRSSRRKKSTVEYFIGDRGFGSLTIGISMFVTLFSTISYLSGPGEVIRYGPGIFFGSLLAIPFSYPVLAYVLLPALMKRRVVSMYELFETRLGRRIRTLGATMFIVYRTLWMAVLMHFGSVALSVILGVGDGAVPLITLVAGAIAVIYTSMGGLRAVITVDVLQFTVLLIGVIATLAVVTVNFGGFGWLPTEWNPQWSNQPFFSVDPTVRVTIVTAAILAFMLDTAHGVDQTQVQRYMASADLGQARRAVLVRILGSALTWTFLVLLGVALTAFYQRHAASLPAGQTFASFADKTFPHFIAHELPIGISGLVVAAILSGMSSIDSGVSAITAVVMNDFIGTKAQPARDEAAQNRLAKRLTYASGALVIGMSLLISSVPGNFYEIASRTFRLFIPIELGLVILALFIRSATPFGVVWGIVYGLSLGVLISYWQVFTASTGISFTLYIPCILTIQLVVSCLVSLLPTRGATVQRLVTLSMILLVALAAIVAGALRIEGTL